MKNQTPLAVSQALKRTEILDAWEAYQTAVQAIGTQADKDQLAEREILVHLSIQVTLLAAEIDDARLNGTLKRVDAHELLRLVSNCLLFLHQPPT